MTVIFSHNTQPCIEWETDGVVVIEYDSLFGKFCDCYKLRGLGLVPCELLTEIESNSDNVRGIELVISLSQTGHA